MTRLTKLALLFCFRNTFAIIFVRVVGTVMTAIIGVCLVLERSEKKRTKSHENTREVTAQYKGNFIFY